MGGYPLDRLRGDVARQTFVSRNWMALGGWIYFGDGWNRPRQDSG